MNNRYYSLFATALLVLLAAPGQADDTDIYFYTGGTVEGAEPMVMFSLDWRPNLGSRACNGNECNFLKGEDFCWMEADAEGAEVELCGLSYTDAGGTRQPYLPVQDSYVYFDLLRAVLRKVMEPLDGLRLGLMLNHDYINNCSGRVEAGCSNGGYIGLGFESFQLDDANGAKEEFHEFLSNIPVPQGNSSHKYQGKELFFEFFRYLTGQEILNGHVGFVDFNGYPEDGSGTGGDTGTGGGTTIKSEFCLDNKVKGTTTTYCKDVEYNPDTQTVSCAIVDVITGVSYAISCTVTDIADDPDTVPESDPKGDNNLDVDNPSIAWDIDIEDVGNEDYISPLQAGGRCTKIFSVNVMFQVSQQDADSDSAIENTIPNGGFGLPQKDFPSVLEYLNDADLANGGENGLTPYGTAADLDGIQNVTSYFITDKINKTTRDYAAAGGTDEPLELAEDPEGLIEDLENLFDEILSVSTTFVSASVPVNAFNRAEVIDNVYLSLFKTDDAGRPFWTGNVKKLKFAEVADGSGDRQLVDNSDPDPQYAVAADGRIKYDALTYWTDAYSLPAPDEAELEVDGKDGRSTVRGGAGQKIPGMIDGSIGLVNGSGTRQLFYDDLGEADGLAELDALDATAGILKTPMGVATNDEALNLIKYARGMDVNDVDGDGDVEEARDWILGDPLHSRPLPINYGAVGDYTEDNQAIYVAFGSNDGFMHFIKNTDSGTPGAESGEEVWAFMPQEVMGELATLEANSLGTGHPYLVDGSPTAYVEGRFIDRAIDGEAVYLYFGLRRGGKAYYGMDISDPEIPELKWKITKSGDFSELGYTFSDPVVGMMRDGTAGKPIVMFGGGYDLNKDRRVAEAELSEDSMDDDEGNALYIVDGETGELIWKATGDTEQSDSDSVFVHEEMRDSIPSKVAALDSDGDQIIDRIYVGDTGGRVWRADINGEDTGAWTMTLLADLGRHYDDTIANDRRFFHPPDIVQHKDNSAYDAVIMGSGNRADPLAAGGAVNNYMYMIKDRNYLVGTATDSELEHSDLGDVTNTCLEVGSECTANLSYGWKLGLTSGTELSLASPLTIGGVSYFTTYLSPGASLEEACGPDEGSGRIYAVRLENAAAVRNYDTTTDALERFDELKSQGIPAEAISLPPDGILKPDLSIEKTDVTTRLRTFWLEAEDGSL